MQIIGQILGIIAVGLTFLSYQANTQKKVLLIQTAATAMFFIHYCFISATSALVLNGVCILRNIVYYYKDKKLFSGKFFPIFFTVVIPILGGLSWQGPISLFIILGLAINTYILSGNNPQTLRKSILLTSSLIIIYNIFVFSIGGIINELVAIVSSVIGIIRTNVKNKEQI